MSSARLVTVARRADKALAAYTAALRNEPAAQPPTPAWCEWYDDELTPTLAAVNDALQELMTHPSYYDYLHAIWTVYADDGDVVQYATRGVINAILDDHYRSRIV